MNKQMTREQFIASLGCGENYRPKEITDRKFYFFKGYIIGLYENGGYSLYKDTVYNSTKEGDILKKAMNRIVELELKEFDERENLRNKVNEEIQKRVEPFITEIVAQVLKGQRIMEKQAITHKHLTVGQLLEMLSKLDPNKEIRYEYDSHSCSMHWLEIQEVDDYYEMQM